MIRLLKSCGLVCAVTQLLLLTALVPGGPLAAQAATQPVTDLQFHTFHPSGAPDAAAQSASVEDRKKQANGMSLFAANQINALNQEKNSRTPAQRKIDSNVLYTLRMMDGIAAAPGVQYLETGVELDANNNIAVDIVANVNESLLNMLSDAGALILYSNAGLRSIRALIPPGRIEGIAASPDVIFISPKQNANRNWHKAAPGGIGPFGILTAPGFDERASNVRAQLASAMNTTGTPFLGQGSVETEGDLTHLTYLARGVYGVNGAGLKIGVLSDGVTSAALSQATGDLPPMCGGAVASPCLTVLSGQTGAGDEGTAMLEIIHDMVPGANLYFATANNSITSFAANIEALQAAGCNIIVDDVFYFVETPFQDGQASTVVSSSQGGAVTQAVNTVASEGVFYFSSAGNQGSLDIATSGTYEGDFVPQASASPLPPGNVHNFGSGTGYDTITSAGDQVVALFWADPLGASGNDYDLYILDPTGASILAASTNIQDGTEDPVELIDSPDVVSNNRIVVFQNHGAQNRFFHLELYRGQLHVNTSGETHGHSAASGAYTVAATPAAATFGPPTPNGPYPGPFVSTNQIENFSSDGLRRIFFNADSSAITPGNFSSTGGTVLNKPDITAADGVSVTGVGGFDNPFYGTSAAAPAAASVAALVLSADPAISISGMKTALESSAIDIVAPGFDRDSGNGIVMAMSAIGSLGVTGGANPQLGTITASENPGNGNGIIEAGEGALLQIQLTNASGVAAVTGISATLSSSTPGVVILQPGTGTYADMAAGAGPEYSASGFQFALSPTIGCGVLVDFELTVSYSGGTSRVLPFTLQTGMLTVTNTLGNIATVPSSVTFATGTETSRLNRNGVVSACGTAKTFPSSIAGGHTFDSYTFTACQAQCVEPQVNAGVAGVNLFESMYSPIFNPASISTGYVGDSGESINIQTFGVDVTAGTSYTVVVNDVAGNPATPPNTYTIQIPSCAFDCNPYPLPIAIAQNVTVTAGANGTASANVNNGSNDPNGGTITVSQNPPGPYPLGSTLVELTVTNSVGAFAQTSATVTVNTIPTTTAAAGATAIFSPSAQNVSLTAAVNSTGPIVSMGTVTFSVFMGGTEIGSPINGTVNNGVAAASFSLPGGTAPGVYTILATYNASGGFATSSDSSQTLTITAATPTITLGSLTQTYNGSPRAASATTIPIGLAVTFTYTGIGSTTYPTSATAPTTAGSYKVAATVSNPNYMGTASGTLVINQATPSVTWATPAAIPYGTALSPTQLDAASTVAGSFAYTPAVGAILTAGTHALSVTFTPTDTTDYATTTANVQLRVNQATASITWATPAAIIYGTALGATQLDATAPVAGAFAYTPALGATLTAGTHALSVTFTPTDATDYATTTATVQLQVNQATASITWATPAAIIYGTALGATQLDATAPVAGAFAYTPALGTTLTAGTHTLSVTFTPTDATDYATAATTVQLTVSQAAQTINFTAITSPVNYGVAPIALDATGGASGNPVIFSIVSGPGKLSGNTLTVSGAGTVIVAANQAGNGDYAAAAQVNESIPVNKALPVAAIASSGNPVLLDNGITLTATINSGAGTPTGTVTFLDGSTTLGMGTLTGGTAMFSTSSLAAGTHTITVAYGGDQNFLGAISSPLTESVEDFGFSISAPTVTASPGGTAVFNFTVAPSGATTLPANIVLSVSGLPQGATYTFSPASLTAGESATQVTLTVSLPQTQTAAAAGNPDLRLMPNHQDTARGTFAGRMAPFALALVLLPFAGRLRGAGRRMGRMLSVILLIVAGMAAVAGITGCGSTSGFFAQQRQSYTVTVTGTAGALSHSATVNLTVE
ncbi:MAG TPA: Ig-like domain repeat protein [Terracidiphilus sp.]